MKFLNKILYIILIHSFSATCLLVAQSSYSLNLTGDAIPDKLVDEFQFESRFVDSLAIHSLLKRKILKLHGEAYLEASIDALTLQDSTYTATLHLGEKYRWAALTNGNVEEAFLEQVGFRERLYSKKPFYYLELKKLQESLLTYAENHGYPFANVWLDNVEIKDGTISAQLFMNTNKLILIEGLEVFGRTRISKKYLENYLGIHKGDLYSKEKVKKIRSRIKELPFLKETQDVTINFKGDKATIKLYVEKKNASRFDFLLGLQPNSQSANNPDVTRFLITGTFNADMHNQFGLGERVFVEFQQLQPGTQELNLQFTYPYVLNLPFGIDTKFDLYKRDSTYLDVNFDFGLQYLFEGGNYIKAFWNNASTTLLEINEDLILASRRLPSNLDVGLSTFGIEYNLQKLDYRFNPRKGWGVLVRGGAGIKTISKNNNIISLSDSSDPTFSFESLYDSLDLKTFQYRISADAAYYFPVLQRGVIKIGLNGGILLSEQAVFQNEQFRIGGNRRLRGFDEESIFATNYAIGTLEYRIIIGQNSYLYLFGDYGYVENISQDIRNFDQPLGFGAGISFETGVGVFGVSYAVGRQQGNPIDVRAAKIHFGYVSYF